MSYGLITELLPDQLQVLLVAEKTLVPQDFLDELQSQHLPAHLSDPSQALTQEILAQAYKIVWLKPLFSQALTASQENSLCQQLQPYQSKVLVVTTLTSGTGDHSPHLELLTKTTQQEREFISKVQALLPEAKLVIGGDVLLSSKEPHHAVLELVMSQLAHGKIIDPQLELVAQTWGAFLKNISSLLLKPSAQQLLVKGKKTDTVVLSKLLQLHLQRLTGLLPEIETQKLSPLPWPEIEEFLTIHGEKPEELVQLLLEKAKAAATKVVPAPARESSSLPYPHRRAHSQGPNQTPVVAPVMAAPLFTAPPIKTSVETLSLTPTQEAEAAPAAKPTVSSLKPAPKPALEPPSEPEAPKLLSPSRVTAPVSQPLSTSLATSTATPKPKETKPVVLATSTAKTAAVSESSSAPTQEAEAELVKLFQSYRSEHKVEGVKTVAEKTTTTKKKSLRKKKFFWLGLVLIAVVVGGGSLFATWILTTANLKHALVATAEASTTTAKLEVASNLPFWHRLASVQGQVLGFLPSGWQAEQTQVLQVANTLTQYQAVATDFDQIATRVFLTMTNRYPVDMASLLPKLGAQSDAAFTHLSETQVYLQQITPYQTASDEKTLSAFERFLLEKKQELSPLQQLQPFLPSLLGLETKKTYALVLQNHQELRPVGGVIQAVAFVTFDKGVITDTQVKSAAALSAQTATPSASPDMARFLGTKNLTLANSAWSPDAPTSADQTISFLEKSVNKNVDGIWFLNTSSLADWVRTVGPLEISEFGEVITHQNLLERLESHSELPVAGQDQPDFAASFLQALLKKTLPLPQEKTPTLARVLFQLFDSKQAAFVVREPEAQTVLRTIGWSGSLIEPACPPPLQQERCLIDAVAQVESNVGQNKANIYLERKVDHRISMLSDAIEHVHTISLKNTATSNAWPRGSYKAYIRLYVPPTARLEAVKINGQNVPTEQTVINFENNRQVFGAYVEVPVQASVDLQYEYFLPTAQAKPFSYALFTQFQPGIETPQYQVTLDSGTFKPSLLAPQATLTGSSAVFKSPTELQSLVGVKYE